jgi:hypothetical protein
VSYLTVRSSPRPTPLASCRAQHSMGEQSRIDPLSSVLPRKISRLAVLHSQTSQRFRNRFMSMIERH